MDNNASAPNWTSYYCNHVSNKDLNIQMGQILDICRFGATDQDCLKNVKDNPGLACIAVDGFHELVLLHQVHVLGPSIVFPEEKVVALSGSTQSADIFKLRKDSLFQDHDIPVPKWASLKGADSVDSLNALTVPETNPTKLRCKSILMLPPLVSTTILTSPSLDPFELIPLLSATFQDFDRTSDTIKACTLLRPVLEFLWAVSKKLITPIIFCPDTSPAGKKWSLQLHLSCITLDRPQTIQSIPDVQNPQGVILDTIADSLRRISDSSDRTRLIEIPDDSKKDSMSGWDKIPDVIQQMILKISSMNDSTFAPGPCETYLQILKQNKSLGAAMIINILLSTMGCQVEITTSMANAIKTGNFRANSLQVAHPFSIFNVPYVDAANMTCFNQTELELLQSEGEGIPKDIVKNFSARRPRPMRAHITY